MSLKQLVLLAVVTIVVVALGVVVYRQQAKSWDPDSSAIGQVVLPDLPINEVAGIGIASVIHQIAIQIAEAAVKVTSGFPGWRSKNNRTNAKRAGPRNSPIRCLDQILLLPVGSFLIVIPGSHVLLLIK